MAHFAEVSDENIVLRVLVIPDEHEADGPTWCAEMFGGRWVQTSYNARIRGKYAGIGDTYDPTNDCFVSPEPPSESDV